MVKRTPRLTIRHSGPSEVDAPLCELEFVRVEHYPCMANAGKEVDGPPPVLSVSKRTVSSTHRSLRSNSARTASKRQL